jgi:hypothetical protein
VINEGLVSQPWFPAHGPRDSAGAQPQNGPAMHPTGSRTARSSFHYFTSHILFNYTVSHTVTAFIQMKMVTNGEY